MDYNLAKRLKDAGFPQHADDYDAHEKDCWEDACVPTLSELIEACGERFVNLENKFHDGGENDGGQQWVACMQEGDKDWVDICFAGDTPEEAVAKLWLKIKQNN